MLATGEPIPGIGHILLAVKIGQLYVDHSLVVVHSLITPVILGIDFLRKHRLVFYTHRCQSTRSVKHLT